MKNEKHNLFDSVSVKIAQLNCANGILATDMLGEKFATSEIDIALVQEPKVTTHKVKGKRMKNIPGTIALYSVKSREKIRAGIYINSNFAKLTKYVILEQFTDKDNTTILTHIKIRGNMMKVLFCSSYCPSMAGAEYINNPVTMILRRVAKFAKDNECLLILGADINSRNHWWGSDSIDERGTKFEDFCRSEALLDVLNQGNRPTFSRTGLNAAQSNIDVTVVSEQSRFLFSNWRVSDEYSGSDHNLIRVELEANRAELPIAYGRKNTNWKKFTKNLQNRIPQLLSQLSVNPTIEKLENEASEFGAALREAHKASSTIKKTKINYHREWFTNELAEYRKRINRIKSKVKRLKSSGSQERLQLMVIEYKMELKEYKKKIAQAQSQQWRNKMSQLQGIKATARLQKLLEKKVISSVNTIKRPDGTFTESREETVEVLMNAHFPGCRKTRISAEIEQELNGHSDDSYFDNDSSRQIHELTSEENIKWALSSFDLFKSPGVDEIFPAMLQKAGDIIIPILKHMFMASIKLKHIPTEWRGTKITFIPKIGKTNYEEASAFRPISLMSFVLKTLEKLMDRRLRVDDNLNNKLNDSQHAYRSARGTASALDNVATELQSCLDKKGKALMLTADVLGAFDRTAFNVSIEALKGMGAKTWSTDWVTQLLNKRKMKAVIQEDEYWYIPETGLPQGGCMSPLIWDAVINSLLDDLTSKGIHATCYADDITVICSIEHGQFDNLAHQMTRALKVLERWCDKSGLGFNPAKMKLIEINKSHTPVTRTSDIKYKGVAIEKVSTLKLLGVHFDEKLNWNHHVDMTLLKGRQALFAAGHFLRFSWGIKPKEALQVYEQIIIPRITYGSGIWWHSVGTKRNSEKFDTLQRLAAKMGLGIFHTTPTVDLFYLAGLPPIKLVVIKQAMQECHRLQTNKLWPHPNMTTGHRQISIIKSRLQSINDSDTIPKIFNTGRRYKVRINDRREWSVGLENFHYDHQWFSDGSKSGEKVGAGVHNPIRKCNLSFRLSAHGTVMQAELTAIMKCCQQYDSSDIGHSIIILCDSQAALMALSKSTIESETVRRCARELDKLAIDNEVTIMWIPAHSGIEGNEQADALAKRGADKEHIEIIIPTSDAILNGAIEKWFEEERRAEWNKAISSRSNYANGMFAISKQIKNRAIWKWKRGKIRAVISILTGHARLNKYINRVDASKNPTCRFCEQDDEDIEHIIMRCDHLDDYRSEALGLYNLDYHDLEELKLENLIQFTKNIGLYTELTCSKSNGSTQND